MNGLTQSLKSTMGWIVEKESCRRGVMERPPYIEGPLSIIAVKMVRKRCLILFAVLL